MTIGFGNGIPLDQIRRDCAGLSIEQVVEKLGDAFLLLHAADAAGSAANTSATGRGLGVLESVPTVPVGAATFVYPVAKRSALTFAFIAVGRNDGNDIHLPHASISRFHAFFRTMNGIVTIQDARSANGTFLGATKVPRQGEGDALPVKPGAQLRFGDVACQFVNSAGLLNATH